MLNVAFMGLFTEQRIVIHHLNLLNRKTVFQVLDKAMHLLHLTNSNHQSLWIPFPYLTSYLNFSVSHCRAPWTYPFIVILKHISSSALGRLLSAWLVFDPYTNSLSF